jgi:hypothetical protein
VTSHAFCVTRQLYTTVVHPVPARDCCAGAGLQQHSAAQLSAHSRDGMHALSLVWAGAGGGDAAHSLMSQQHAQGSLQQKQHLEAQSSVVAGAGGAPRITGAGQDGSAGQSQKQRRWQGGQLLVPSRSVAGPAGVHGPSTSSTVGEGCQQVAVAGTTTLWDVVSVSLWHARQLSNSSTLGGATSSTASSSSTHVAQPGAFRAGGVAAVHSSTGIRSCLVPGPDGSTLGIAAAWATDPTPSVSGNRSQVFVGELSSSVPIADGVTLTAGAVLVHRQCRPDEAQGAAPGLNDRRTSLALVAGSQWRF